MLEPNDLVFVTPDGQNAEMEPVLLPFHTAGLPVQAAYAKPVSRGQE